MHGSRCRVLAASLALALAAGTDLPALAQTSSSTGIVQITVKDAAKNETLGDARVFLFGPTVASALTNKSGIVKYTDVPSGIYRVRVGKPKYAGVTSRSFEVLGDKEVDVDVDLGVQPSATTAASTATGSASGLKIIGTTRARVVINVSDVDQDSAVRKISDSLTDALSTLAGVDVTSTSNDPNSPQTISLNGQDESQTAITLDGIPLGAPGAATDLRGVNTDLFTGAGVSFGPQAGALAGSVNFRTLEPTQTWQEIFSGGYGTFDRYNAQLGETGSIGKLGIALLTTKRAGNNPLTFNTYEDQSGLTYPHGGESGNIGDFLKLRYELGEDTNVLLTALENNQSTTALCTTWVTPLPCGIGPGNGSSSKFGFAYATIQSLVGQTAVSITGYVNDHTSFTDDLERTIASADGSNPVLSPSASTSATLARGIAASATLTEGFHTITLNGSTYAGITQFTPLAGGEGFVVPSESATASRQVQLSDSYKVSDKVTLGPSVSYAGTTGEGESLLAGFSVGWRPTASDTYSAQANVGSSVPGNGLIRTYSDPQSARVDCPAETAMVSGPGDLPQPQRATNVQASWIHQWAHGQLVVNAYRQDQSNQLVSADLTAGSLGLVGSPYWNDVVSYFGTVCGAGFGPAPTVYVTDRVAQTARLYQGYNATAHIGIGKNVVLIPSYATQVAELTGADPLFLGPGSTLIIGGQLPGRPVHTANLTIDAYHPPSGLEFLANAHYVGPNNNQNIAPYVLVNAGISHAVGIGRLTVFASNLFNTESAPFATLQWAQPIPLAGGGELYQAARPNAPRSYTVTFSFNTGARPGAGFARPSKSEHAAAAKPSASPAPRGFLGFGQLKFIAPPPGTDPLALATPRPECTADLRPVATTVLAQLGAAAAAFAAGKPLPGVDGVDVVAHGTASATWWFGLGPKIPQGLLPQRRGPEAGGPRGGPGREPGVPGVGGPPGFQDRIAVGPEAARAPRPRFTPSPQLLAALVPFRALVSCSYGTVVTPAQAAAQGFDVPVPFARPSPAPSPAPGRPAERRVRRPQFLYYAPKPGIFVVRPPSLGTGGGSVKQTP